MNEENMNEEEMNEETNEKGRKKVTTKQIVIGVIVIIALAVAGYFGFTHFQNVQHYNKAVSLTCDKKYAEAYKVLKNDVPEDFKESENLTLFLSIAKRSVDADDDEYEDILKDLEDVKKFQDEDLQKAYDDFEKKAEKINEEYQEALSEAEKIDAMIDDLPKISRITLKNEDDIEEIRDRYEAASSKTKKLVESEDKLRSAEKRLTKLHKAKNIETAIDDIGTVTLDSGKKIKAARKAYDSADDDVQDLVSNYSDLKSAELKLKRMKRAHEVEKVISAIGDVSLNSREKILAARNAYDKLPDKVKKYVSNYSVLRDAEDEYAGRKAAKEVDDLIGKIGDVSLNSSSQEKISNARTAYNKLLDSQKKYVSKYDTLTKAEDKYAQLKKEKEEKEQKEKEKAEKQRLVYWTESGTHYHFSIMCSRLDQDEDLETSTAEVAEASGRKPCSHCK